MGHGLVMWDTILGDDWGFPLGTAPPVTVYIRGPIKGYISPYYTYYATVTERGAVPKVSFYSRLSMCTARTFNHQSLCRCYAR